MTVKAAYSKRRRDDRQPIRPDLADALESWFSAKSKDGPLFNLPDKQAQKVRADLRWARAGWIKAIADRSERRKRRKSDFLCVRDSEGRVVDFHALRMTFITMLVKSGASVKEAQDLARHSDPKLTMNVYTRLGVHDLAGALERMPHITPDRTDRLPVQATGTDNATSFDPASSHDSSSAKQRIRVRSGAMKMEDKPAPLDAHNPLPFADVCDSVRPEATENENALCRTRTCDPLIKSCAVRMV